MYLDCEPPIAGGREVWGFPKKYAKPVFGVKNDTVYGRLEYNGEEVAVGTMVYKHQTIPEVDALKALSKTCVNLKIIPDVDYAPKIAQLVAYNLTNIKFKGAWSGPARLQLSGALTMIRFLCHYCVHSIASSESCAHRPVIAHCRPRPASPPL